MATATKQAKEELKSVRNGIYRKTIGIPVGITLDKLNAKAEKEHRTLQNLIETELIELVKEWPEPTK